MIGPLRRKRHPAAPPAQYVALGSSFAAGMGLGPPAPGSPRSCRRSANGYPQHLARLRGLSLVDVTCSGSTSTHVLRGGRFFRAPQLDALGEETELVTLTTGGNDVGYVGDLKRMADRARHPVIGRLLGLLRAPPKSAESRDFPGLGANLRAILREIARRAPRARVVVVTYPVILPPAGTCAQLGIGAAEAELMRSVAGRLAAVTREAAAEAGAVLVDMARLSEGHDACSRGPWVAGAAPTDGAPFHPTLAGTLATARQIGRVLDGLA